MSNAILFERLRQFLPDSIDVYFACASFESRSVVASRWVSMLAVNSAVLFYAEKYVAVSRNNLNILISLFAGAGKSVGFNVYDPIQMADIIVDEFERIPRKGYGCNVVIDATTFTRESLLILFRVLHKYRRNIARATIIYTPAKTMSSDWLSKGVVEYRPVLGYLGDISPIRKLHMIMMIGFEIDRARKIIARYEPDKISVGIGAKDNSIRTEFFERNKKFATELENIFGEGVGRFEFSLTDPYDAEVSINSYLANFHDEFNTVISPLNNKISTIGAGLVAIGNKSVQLCYAQPEVYNTDNYSTADDICYITEIRMDKWI